MPKTTKSQTPSAVLQKFIDDYQTNPFALSKSLGVTYQTVTHIIKGISRITPQMAIRLAKYFSNTPEFWLDIQIQSEIDEFLADKKFTAELNKIPKAKLAGKQPTGKAARTEKEPIKGRRKSVRKPEVPKKTAKAKSRKKTAEFRKGKAKKK